MTRKGRARADSRWDDYGGKPTFAVPMALIRHPNFTRLSAWGHKLIADLAAQYTGKNNGYLCATRSLMESRGWNKNTLGNAVRELEHYRLIERTQQGGRNKPNLFAFTWRRIDEHHDRRPLDVRATPTPSNAWQTEVEPFVLPKKKDTQQTG